VDGPPIRHDEGCSPSRGGNIAAGPRPAALPPSLHRPYPNTLTHISLPTPLSALSAFLAPFYPPLPQSLAYAQAASAVRTCAYRLRPPVRPGQIPFLAQTVAQEVTEILQTGTCAKLEAFRWVSRKACGWGWAGVEQGWTQELDPGGGGGTADGDVCQAGGLQVRLGKMSEVGGDRQGS